MMKNSKIPFGLVKRKIHRYTRCVLFIMVITLAGCSSLSGGGPLEELPTATPLPGASTDDGLEVQPPGACLIGEDAVAQLLKPMGNLLAWQPGQDKLAYLAPVSRAWGWGVGDAVIAPVSDGEPVSTNDARVAGDLTWSPDGAWLAFVALRASDDQYSVFVWRPADDRLIDLLGEGAISDAYSSLKGIDKWLDNDRLRISESCGVDCRQLLAISVLGGEQRILRQIRESEDTSLAVDSNHPAGFSLNEKWLNPNVSPDGLSVFFSDKKAVGWIASIEEGIKFPLDLKNGAAQESKWSDDSRYLAVRTEQQVLVFELNCHDGGEVRRLGE